MRVLILPLVCLPSLSFAAGGGGTLPAPTETVTTCDAGLVFDEATESCVPPGDSTNDDNAMLEDVRRLAYEGQYQAALDLLDALDNPQAPLALTYYGFANRKAGRLDLGMAYYARALVADPNNLLARSYMGQGYVEAGNTRLAQVQLDEIRTRGGTGTWAEWSLASALETGQGYSY